MDILTLLLVLGLAIGICCMWLSHNDIKENRWTFGLVVMCVSIIGLGVKFLDWLIALVIVLIDY